MAENERLDEIEIKNYLLKTIEKYISPAPVCAIGVNVRELVYSEYGKRSLSLNDKEKEWEALRQALNDDLISRLIKELVSEGKIKKSTEGNEERFCGND